MRSSAVQRVAQDAAHRVTQEQLPSQTPRTPWAAFPDPRELAGQSVAMTVPPELLCPDLYLWERI